MSQSESCPFMPQHETGREETLDASRTAPHSCQGVRRAISMRLDGANRSIAACSMNGCDTSRAKRGVGSAIGPPGGPVTPRPPDRHRDASATSGMPDGPPTSIHLASDSREKSWSSTIDDAPMTPASAPSEERWIRRSRVASGSDRR
jgi:hypothetical protein